MPYLFHQLLYFFYIGFIDVARGVHVKVKVEKIYGNSKFKIEKVEAKIGSIGAWIDITDDGTVYFLTSVSNQNL